MPFIFSFLIIALLIVPAFAATDDYAFHVGPGTNTLNLNKSYNGSFVQNISGTFTGNVEVIDGDFVQFITIESDTARDNVLVNFTVPKQQAMNPDYSDLRFYYLNGTSIPYYLGANNSASANLSVKLDLVENNNMIIMSFGNPSATSQSNLNSMYIYTYNNTTGFLHQNATPYVFYEGSYTNVEFTAEMYSQSSMVSGYSFRPRTYANGTLPTPYVYGNYSDATAIFQNNDWVGVTVNTTAITYPFFSGRGNRLDINTSITDLNFVHIEGRRFFPANNTTQATNSTTGNNSSRTPFLNFVSFAAAGSANGTRLFDAKIYNTTETKVTLGHVASLDPKYYMQAISINSDATRDNVLVNLTVARQSQMNSDYSDLRFSWVNGTSIPYFIESSNSTFAEVKIKANLTSGYNTVFMSFGDPTRTSESNPHEVYFYYLYNESGEVIAQNTTLFEGGRFTNFDASTRFGWATGGTMGFYIGEGIIGGGTGEGITTRTGVVKQQNYYYAILNDTRASTDRLFPLALAPGDTGYPLYMSSYNFSTNADGTLHLDANIYYLNDTPWRDVQRDGTNSSRSPMTRFQAFEGYGQLPQITYYEAKAYNSTNTTVNFGQPAIVQPESVNFSVNPGIFSTLNFTTTRAGDLNLTVQYTPHVSEWSINATQPNGRVNFFYKPVDVNADYRWEVATDNSFTNVILTGVNTPAEINSTGFINVAVVDQVNLKPGQYFWRLRSADAGNNTTFAMESFQTLQQASFELRFIDGITGEWINRENSTTAAKYLSASVGNVPASNISNASQYNVSRFQNLSRVNVSQGGITKQYTVELPINESGQYNTGMYLENVTIGEPITIQYITNDGSAPWSPQTYILTLDQHEIGDGILNLSLERRINYLVENTTHGLIFNSRGEAVPSAQITVNNSSTGAFIGTYSSMAGGQYAFRSNDQSSYYSFSAFGYQTISGEILRIKQDILMLATPTIRISVIDVDTGQPVRFFSTYLGDNQTIRSTDNGTVVYDNVTEGQHQVIIQADGYSQATRSINVSSTQTEFVLSIKKQENQTTWDELNFVTFYIQDQNNRFVTNCSITITSNGVELYNKTLYGAAAFTVELNRSLDYIVTITKTSEDVNESIRVYGSQLGTQMYLTVYRPDKVQPPTLSLGLTENFVATPYSLMMYVNSSDSRISNIYFSSVNATYIRTSDGQTGVLGSPSISYSNGQMIATWDLSLYNFENTGGVVTVNYELKSMQTGDQTKTGRKTINLGRSDLSFPTFNLNQNQRNIVSCLILAVLAAITASAGIPYASTLVPTIAWFVLRWAGWISWEVTFVILLALGLIVVLYNLIKGSRL